GGEEGPKKRPRHTERTPAPRPPAPPGQHPHPRPAGPLPSLGEQRSLADPSRAGDHHEAATTSPRRSKQAVDARQLTLALQQAALPHPQTPPGGRQPAHNAGASDSTMHT